MKPYNFSTQSNRADWQLPFQLNAYTALGGLAWDAPDTEVVVGLTMDGWTWDDYGFPRNDTPPLWSASSNDGSTVVTLVMPSSVQIVVPASAFNRIGQGTMDVGVRFIRNSTGATTQLLIGRLPIVNGWV